MTSAVEQTLELIQQSLEKVTLTNKSVEKITTDSKELGDHIQVIDSAIKEVETSNTQLVSNMEQISSIVDKMTKAFLIQMEQPMQCLVNMQKQQQISTALNIS